MITNAATITVERSGEKYHTLQDWKMAIENTDYIGAPVMESRLLTVPGASKVLDISEALTGYPVYTSRQISITMGCIKKDSAWDGEVSRLRNILNGQMVKVVFDNDKNYYWRGRAQIVDFERNRRMGKLRFELPNAEPYKYDIYDSREPWRWDTFSFISGIISQDSNVEVNGTAEYMLAVQGMPIVPVFDLKSGEVSVEYKGVTYALEMGENRFPDFVLYDEKEFFRFSGSGSLSVVFRRGSL